jgi:hypothetical protein
MKRYPGRLSLAEHQALAARVRQIQCEVDAVYHLVAETWGFAHPVAKALERVHLSGRNPLDRVRCRLDDAFYRDPALCDCRSPYFGEHALDSHAEAAAAQDAHGVVSQDYPEDPCINAR